MENKWSIKRKILTLIGIILLTILVYGLVTDEIFEWGKTTKAFIVGIWLELVIFITNLTRAKLIWLGLKRWVMDHIISRHIKESFIAHLIIPLSYWWHVLTPEQKAKMFLPAFLVSIGTIALTGLSNVAGFAAIKAVIIGFFKGLWMFVAMLWSIFISKLWTPWIYPIIEIFALSWLVDWLNKIPIVRNHITPWFVKVFLPWFKKNIIKRFNFLHIIFVFIGELFEKYLHNPIKYKMNKVGISTSKKLMKKMPSSTAKGCSRIWWKEGCDEYPP
jgi:hypothetical protein